MPEIILQIIQNGRKQYSIERKRIQVLTVSFMVHFLHKAHKNTAQHLLKKKTFLNTLN